MGADGATSREGAAESRRRMRQRGRSGGARAALGGAHIVSVYHSHVTKFSPHRETLLTSTEHVAFDTYTCRITAAFPAVYENLFTHDPLWFRDQCQK